MSKIDLLEFIPEKVMCGKLRKEIPINVKTDDFYVCLSYATEGYNKSKREYSLTIPRYFKRDKETFDILGLLQAEMGKTDNGNISFSNHEPRLINKVLKWFEKELELNFDKWRWNIKLNINEPVDENHKKKIEEKVINHWLSKTKINLSKKYPKTVTYIKNTKNTQVKYHDSGTLIIEHKSNLLSQIIKKYVKTMPHKIPPLEKDEIRGFMRGIIAGESNVEVYKPDKRYRVYISAIKKEELDLYQKYLINLGIYSKQYQNDKIIISKRKNNIELLKQKLICLSPQKYNRFLNMMKLYPNISKETGYFTGKRKPHNKIPQEKINRILDFYKSGITRTKDIAKNVGVNVIKVQRILKGNNLGKRLIKTPESKRKEIAQFARENPELTQKQIAEHFKVHESVARRAYIKYL